MRTLPYAGIAATALCAAAVAGFGAALAGYSQSLHPVALLGAKGFPHALAFNLLAFVLPGMLAGAIAIGLRYRLPADAGWSVRVGAQLVFLSALGFIALGLLPLDAEDLNSAASRYHATAWMLWWVAFVPGALLLAVSGWRHSDWRGFAGFSLAAALLTLAAVLFGVELLPPGIAQRLAFGLWLIWLWRAGWRLQPLKAA
ncbi:DUF998 domain-containing protein [Pseudoxanthomonas wuyuanensis]